MQTQLGTFPVDLSARCEYWAAVLFLPDYSSSLSWSGISVGCCQLCKGGMIINTRYAGSSLANLLAVLFYLGRK